MAKFNYTIESDIAEDRAIRQATIAPTMANVLWEFNVNVARKWLKKTEFKSEAEYAVAEEIFKDFRGLCAENGLVDLDSLIE